MTEPQHPRRSLFAVWHWPWWTWIVLGTSVLVTYLLSPPITTQLAVRAKLPFAAQRFLTLSQYPLWLALRDYPSVAAIYQAESDLIDALLGTNRTEISWRNGYLEVNEYPGPSTPSPMHHPSSNFNMHQSGKNSIAPAPIPVPRPN